jgi:hypothetical protein
MSNNKTTPLSDLALEILAAASGKTLEQLGVTPIMQEGLTTRQEDFVLSDHDRQNLVTLRQLESEEGCSIVAPRLSSLLSSLVEEKTLKQLIAQEREANARMNAHCPTCGG